MSERLSSFCLSSSLTRCQVKGEFGCSLHSVPFSSVYCVSVLSNALLRCGCVAKGEKFLLFKKLQYYWYKKLQHLQAIEKTLENRNMIMC